MGAWGEHPLESDAGAELVEHALAPVASAIARALRHPMSGEHGTSEAATQMRAACCLLELIGYANCWPAVSRPLERIGIAHLLDQLQLACTRLDELAGNDAATRMWADKDAIQAEIARQRHVLSERMLHPELPSVRLLCKRMSEIAAQHTRKKKARAPKSRERRA